MAKDLEPDDVPFEIPEFNENEYVRKELISFRTTIVLFVFSLVVALLTLAIYRYVYDSRDLGAPEFFVLIVFALACAGALPFLFRLLRIDIGHFKRREWIGTTTLHFFFWLGFTLLLTNPPLSDNAAPRIDAAAAPMAQGLGFDVTVGAYVADNEGLDDSKTRFCVLRLEDAPARYGDLTADQLAACTPWQRDPSRQVWTYTWKPEARGSYYYYVHAEDKNGLVADHRGVVNVTNPFPVINGPQNGQFASLNDRLYVRPDPSLNLLSVLYQIEGRTYNMTVSQDRAGYWVTDPTYPGWKVGANSVTILAVEQPSYLHDYRLSGGRVQDVSALRNFTVAADYPDLGKEQEPRPQERLPPDIAGTPGPGAAIVLVAILGAVLVARRARRDERP